MQEIISSTGILTLDAFALRLLILCTPHSLLEHFHTALLPSSTSLVTIDLDTFGRSRGLLSSLGAGLGCLYKISVLILTIAMLQNLPSKARFRSAGSFLDSSFVASSLLGALFQPLSLLRSSLVDL